MILAICTHDKNMKWPKQKYVRVVIGFPTYNPGFSTSKINIAINPRESETLDPIAVFHRSMVLAIPTHEKDMKWPKPK